MKPSINFKWNKSTYKKLHSCPNIIMYEVARRTLDLTYPRIPMDTGELRKSSISKGVRGQNGNYWIGSYTDYAKDVWDKNNVRHWTTPNTYNRWYERTWKKEGMQIIKNAIERNIK